nr:hypothetical protein [Candidatus Anoxychlamydiales bacterium]
EIKNQINLLTKDEEKVKTDLEKAHSRVNSIK